MQKFKIYNSISQQLEVFEPIQKDIVNMYVCGPTVYDFIHIGNARPVIVFDMVKRVLETAGYRVHYVSNITDIDDKIIERAQALNISESELTSIYTEAFIKASLSLGSMLPDDMPKATEYIMDMIEYIQDLIDKDFAYVTTKGVYFSVEKVIDYGVLSKQIQENLESDVRILNDLDKKSPQDFNLWKLTDHGIQYDSPWGKGRPGWHTECAVMNHKIFDGMIDIHGGGSDLKFPHHENERAQSVAHNHHGLAKYWMHNGRLNVDHQKMSKSLGNFVLVKDLIQADLKAFRFLILAHHYRQPIQYSESLFIEYKTIYSNIEKKLKFTQLQLKAEHVDVESQAYSMEDIINIFSKDFDTPNVITKIYELIKLLNKSKENNYKAIYLNQVIKTLDILGIEVSKEISDEDIETYHQWNNARTQKNYELADQHRVKLTEKGYM